MPALENHFDRSRTNDLSRLMTTGDDQLVVDGRWRITEATVGFKKQLGSDKRFDSIGAMVESRRLVNGSLVENAPNS